MAFSGCVFVASKLRDYVAFVQCIVYILVMREVNIESLDLNLLFALKALLDERHVTKAAEKIGLSQPAMSRALGRLRVMFKDPLLVKGTGGMTLTARASSLYQPLQAIFSEITHMITDPTVEPAQMTGNVVIATRDYEMVSILPGFIKSVSEEAPGLTIRVVPMEGDDLSPLELHEVDFVLAGTDKRAATLNRTTVVKDNFIVVMAANNPLANEDLTLEKYLDSRHCVVAFSEFRTGLVDTTLGELGHKRNQVVKMPQFLGAAFVIPDSDLIATLPRRLGAQLAQQPQFVTRELPFKVPGFSIYLYWHVRNQNSPMHNWLRKMFRV